MLLFSKLHQDLRTRLRVLIGFIIGFGQFTNSLLQTKQLLFTKTNLKTSLNLGKGAVGDFMKLYKITLRILSRKKYPQIKHKRIRNV